VRPASDLLRPPAVAIIVVGVLNLLVGGYSLLSFCLNLNAARSPSGNAGAVATSISFQVVALLGVLTAPVIVAGGLQALQARSYGLVRAAAFLAMIPGVSCCFFLGIPAGVWLLATLNRPGVTESFEDPD
jgi:hypothetical protein